MSGTQAPKVCLDRECPGLATGCFTGGFRGDCVGVGGERKGASVQGLQRGVAFFWGLARGASVQTE